MSHVNAGKGDFIIKILAGTRELYFVDGDPTNNIMLFHEACRDQAILVGDYKCCLDKATLDAIELGDQCIELNPYAIMLD